MSRQLKRIEGEALGAFLLDAFNGFCKSWQNPKDLNRIAVSFASNGFPIVGNPQTLTTLFRAAAFPDRIRNDRERADLYWALYARCPDFVLALLAHLRKQLSEASPQRRFLLFTEAAQKMRPKEIHAALPEAVEYGTVKAERRQMRQSVESISNQRRKAAEELHKQISENLSQPAPCQTAPPSAKRRRTKRHAQR